MKYFISLVTILACATTFAAESQSVTFDSLGSVQFESFESLNSIRFQGKTVHYEGGKSMTPSVHIRR